MTHEKKPDARELIEILTAISIVSKRLAVNLSRKAAVQMVISGEPKKRKDDDIHGNTL